MAIGYADARGREEYDSVNRRRAMSNVRSLRGLGFAERVVQ